MGALHRTRHARWLLRTLLCWLLATAAGARADAAIDVGRLAGGLSITPRAAWYKDATGRLGLDDVRAAPIAGLFVPTPGEVAVGLERAAVWLRFDAVNHADTHRAWMLLLAYPHLDAVTLHVLHADGRVEHYDTGDMRPFAERPVAQPDFVFPLENAPQESVRLFLRVATTGTLSLPLSAWSVPDLLEHQGRTHSTLWMFAGALLMMAVYNAAVSLLIRQAEYLSQALVLTAMSAAMFTFSGLTFQYLLPHQPELANKAIGFFLTLAVGGAFITASHVAGTLQGYAWYRRSYARAAMAMLGVSVALPFLSKEVGLRLAIVSSFLGLVFGALTMLSYGRNPPPQLRLYVASWYFPLLGVPTTVLVNFGVLPPWPVLSWAAYLGCAAQAVLTSLGLAARVKVMGDHLAGLNAQLSSNVVRLEHALENAKQANEAAQRATRAKDDFLATMSHELRTPLNAIINVPQGLLEDFVDEPTARCKACRTTFVVEARDVVDASTACPECSAVGQLQLGPSVHYTGDPAKTSRFLRRIETAGHHLLQLVNGVLDFSKMEAGRLELNWSEVDLEALIRDAVDAMTEPAQKKHITIAIDAPMGPLLRAADPVRLKQVFLNLLSNAIKFSEEGGAVSVRVGWDAAAEADVICIEDQGIGIAPAHHERIFGGFEQVHQGTNRKYGGTGLGLPISRNLVRMHGGELWVESALGHGSTFLIRLPRTPPRASVPPAQGHASG